jgi:hypothetical protein
MALRANLLGWQWDGYPRFHRDRTNLIIHLFAVPLFVAALATAIFSAVELRWARAGVCLAVTALAFVAQGIGHKREANPSIPFDGPLDAFARILVEQFITFPRFVLSGRWRAALRGQETTRGEDT